MTSVGERLKAEREAKQLSTSQVAEATRMKIQTIEQIERNEFDKIAAPIYARGFIRMYAEFRLLVHPTSVKESLRFAVKLSNGVRWNWVARMPKS